MKNDINILDKETDVLSDIRLKKNIFPLTENLNKILKIEIIKYQWNELTQKENKSDIGFIAQNVQLVIPEAVYESKLLFSDMNALALLPDKILAVLIGAVKEQHEHIKILESRIENLENQVKLT